MLKEFCPLLGKCCYLDAHGDWNGEGAFNSREACIAECRKLAPEDPYGEIETLMTALDAKDSEIARLCRALADVRRAMDLYPGTYHPVLREAQDMIDVVLAGKGGAVET